MWQRNNLTFFWYSNFYFVSFITIVGTPFSSTIRYRLLQSTSGAVIYKLYLHSKPLENIYIKFVPIFIFNSYFYRLFTISYVYYSRKLLCIDSFDLLLKSSAMMVACEF